jgi:hypothetical protein
MTNQKPAAADLGQPHITFAGFRLWIHGREFEAAQDYWDGNWLRVTVHYGAKGVDVWTQGPILHLGELEHWLRELEEMNRALSGKAELAPVEPYLHLGFEMEKLGHIDAQIYITPDNMSQYHEFREQIDQSYLPGLIRQITAVLQNYPLRGERPREGHPSDLESKDRRLGRFWSRGNWLGIRIWR